MDEIQLLQRKFERERLARQEAEQILEQKAIELHKTNEELQQLNENLEQKIKERTIELERSEKRYRLIIESAQDFIFRTTPEGYFTYVNPIAFKKFGYTKEELIGTHFTSFVPTEYQDVLMDMYISYRDSQLLNSYLEFPVVSKEGDIFWVGQNVRFIVENDEVKEVTGVARDITERKLAEDALTTTQLRMTSLIKNLHAGILVEDENRTVVLANRLYCKYFKIHHSPQELIGTDCKLSAIRYKHLFLNPDEYAKKIEVIIKARKPVTGIEFHTADGKILEQDYTPITNGDQHLGHLWQYRDITQKYLAEEQLKRSEEKYRGILQNMELGLMEVDNDQIIQKVYDWFCDMTGYTEEELLGKNAQKVFLPEEYWEQQIEQQTNRAQGQAGIYEVQLKKKDGSLIWVLISGAPIIGPEGDVTGSIGIHYDITAQKNLQLELEQAKSVAEDAEKAEKQFLARMSHEIRTPLNAIIGISHLLDDTPLNDVQKDFVDSLKSSSDILQKLISDILDLSKITAGGLEVHPRPFDLRGTIKSLEKTFQLKLQDNPVQFEATIDQEINTMMIGDDLLLNQILLNLIGNAVKFTNKGKISLSADILKQEGNTSWMKFEIKDTGIGIQSDHLDSIFENFRQANNEIRYQFGGTGLGLPITKKLVELQHGKISVQSVPGQGTTFTFTLPYEKSDKKISLSSEIKPVKDLKETINARVLVAEDNFMNRKYISTLFEKWELDFEFAFNGKEAVELAQKQQFDLILMDISMPEMNGYDASILIRNTSNPNQNIPIVALTANAMVAQRTQSQEVGMTDFLAKPFKPDQLKIIIQKYCVDQEIDLSLVEEQAEDDGVFAFPKVLDLDHLEFLYNGDLNYAAEMFTLFLEYTMVEYQKIQTLLDEKDVEGFQHQVHKLKPNFSLVGLSDIEQQMRELEAQAAQKVSIEILQPKWSAVDKKVDNYLPIIQETLGKMKVTNNTP